MKLIDLLSNYQIKDNILYLLDQISVDSSTINKSYITNVDKEISLINYQLNNLLQGKAVFYGIDITLDNLSEISNNQKLNIREFENESHGGKIIIYDSLIIGFIIVKRNKKCITPSDWDGSNKMLEEVSKNH